MSFNIEHDTQLDEVIDRVNEELAKEKKPFRIVDDRQDHDGYMVYSLKDIDEKEETFSREQIERFRAAFRCLELAKAELPNSDLISIACEYGAGINLTREECEKLLSMNVRDVINLEI